MSGSAFWASSMHWVQPIREKHQRENDKPKRNSKRCAISDVVLFNSCDWNFFTACINIYNDQYCQMHLGNCWRPATAANLVKNCRKTCVCKCCSSSPVPLPTTATLSKTTTAKKVSTTRQTTAAIILYTTATARQTMAATILYSTKTASQTTAVTVLYSASTEERKTTTGTKGTFVNYSIKVFVQCLALASRSK